MGILKSGLLGPFRKKVGPVVGRHHRGQNIMTGLHHKSDKPYTAKQLETQSRFGLLSSFLSNIDVLVNIGFKQYAKGKTPVNAAYSYNYSHAFIKTGDVFSINYPKMVYSIGHIATPEEASVIVIDGNIKISWLPQPQSAYCQYTDKASFLIYNQEKNVVVVQANRTERFTQDCMIEIPRDFAGNTLHCYMSFTSANGKLTGDSVYIGKVTL